MPPTRPDTWRAHPRGRGGACPEASTSSPPYGASPRARGSRDGWQAPTPGVGRIPAGAGEPKSRSAVDSVLRAHPRGRGGACPRRTCRGTRRGASPRARGSRRGVVSVRKGHGRIPAGAGEPPRYQTTRYAYRAHPRGRGGAGVKGGVMEDPRGASPRARGSPNSLTVAPNVLGRIPAGAGEPFSVGSMPWSAWAHPRGRGGARGEPEQVHPALGASPRARGSHRLVDGAGRGGWRIPAGAGEPARARPGDMGVVAHPRGRGGAAVPVTQGRAPTGASPRARGSHPEEFNLLLQPRRIPAGAGEPSLAQTASRF